MTKQLFEILKKAEKEQKLSAEEISELRMHHYVDDENKINETGLAVLEPYRVKRAVIMAAGFGSRMVPITLTTPKPLVKVKGVRFIDTLIQRLVKVGITDITIVRGYLKEKFDELLIDYPFLKFIDNDKYDKENNISSAVLAKHLLTNAYLCEADFYIIGEDVIEKYQFETNYLGTPVIETDDWCYDVDQNGRAYNYRKGGKNCVQAFGISYWSEHDGRLLDEKLTELYEEVKNRQLFWEMCVFEAFKSCFNVYKRLVEKNSIFEIDTYNELCAIDSSYIKS